MSLGLTKRINVFYTQNMKMNAIKYCVVSILVSFVVSIGGNASACAVPFSMNLEKTLMRCSPAGPPETPISHQMDENCKDSLFKDGQIHHSNSSFHVLILKNFNIVSTSFMALAGIHVEPPAGPHFFFKDPLRSIRYSSTPLYTFHHSFLI